jgi:hypothetical protein
MMRLFRWLALVSVLSLAACSESGPSSVESGGGAAASELETLNGAVRVRVEEGGGNASSSDL